MIQELRHGIDLIIVSTVGETADLVQKLLQPRGLARQEHQPAFDLVRLDAHAADLVDLSGVIRDHGIAAFIIPQGLYKCIAAVRAALQ